jgi:serine/threonine-protein kinase
MLLVDAVARAVRRRERPPADPSDNGARPGIDYPASGLTVGSYHLIEPIGAGGAGVVYSAVHAVDGTAAAVKLLPLGWNAIPELRDRLVREAAALRSVEHPNVVRIFELGDVDARRGATGWHLAMEWLPHALDRLLRALRPEPLPLPRVLRIARAVADGLGAVHAVGLVHRDVKPANVLLRADGTAVVADFGLAAVIADLAAGLRLTPPNVVVGTPEYMAPEQVVDAPVDGRADVYALGVVLYEMLMGRVPFPGRNPLEVLRAHAEADPPPLAPDLPAPVRAIVARALEKRAVDRFPTAGAMSDALGLVSAAL